MSHHTDEMTPPSPPEAFRESLLGTTLRSVKRRAGRKRALVLCGVAGAYALGVFTTLSGSEPAPPPPQVALKTTMPGEAPKAPASNTPPGDTLHDAERAALMAARESPEQRREALREAGNRSLDVQGDIARATQLYGRFLDTMPADELGRFDPDETWLLRALRCARLQENAHENADI